MLKALSQSIRFEAFFTSNKQGKTSLTATCDVYKNSTLILSGAAVTEIGGGLYVYTLAGTSVDTAGLYTAIFKTTDTSVDQQHIPSLWDAGENWVANMDGAVSAIPTSVWGNLTRSLTDKVGFSLTTAPPTASDIATAILVTPANKLATSAGGWVTVNVLSSGAIQSIWDALTSAFLTPGSIGYKFKNWVYGTDGKALVSTDAGSGAFTDDDREKADFVYGKFDQTAEGPVALVPAPPSGPIPLATIAFDATAFGIDQPGVEITYEMVETKTIMIAKRFQIPRAVKATTDEDSRALVYLFPSSELRALGNNYSPEYRVSCPDAKINAIIEVPDEGALLADLL